MRDDTEVPKNGTDPREPMLVRAEESFGTTAHASVWRVDAGFRSVVGEVMRKSILFLIALVTTITISCGRDSESCVSIGPFGDCGDKYPTSGNNNGTRTGGPLKARVEGPFKVNDVVEVKVEGGAGNYVFEVRSGNLTQCERDGSTPPKSIHSPFFKANAAIATAIIEVEDNNGTAPNSKTDVQFKIN